MHKYLVEARHLLMLAGPVIIAQIAQTTIGFLNTLMASAVSATDMAAVAIGTSIWLPAILFGYGLILALTPVVAQLNGSGKIDNIAYQVFQTYWLAAIASIFIMFVLHNANHILNMIHHIDPILANKTVKYLHAMQYGVPGYLFFQVLRNKCDGLANTKPGMVIAFISLIVNIPVAYILIYGKFGIPAFGGVGCGIATAFVYWLMFIIMITWLHFTNSNQIKITCSFIKPDWKVLSRLITLGLPIALSFFFEVTLFAIVALLIAPLGIVQVASHQIALNFSSLVFVLPLSLSVATTIRISFQLGKGYIKSAQVAAKTAQVTGIVIASITAILTAVYREHIALFYNNNQEIVAIATQLLLLAAIYQISDSIQIIGSGILRGYKDTSSISIITFIAYWLLGLPCGYVLALKNWIVNPLGPVGFWIGFIIGLTASAIMMLYRIHYLQKLSGPEILNRVSR
ncbi:MAG: MATE family efflux transporter [Candidatus Dasytiphilus stammeri]